MAIGNRGPDIRLIDLVSKTCFKTMAQDLTVAEGEDVAALEMFVAETIFRPVNALKIDAPTETAVPRISAALGFVPQTTLAAISDPFFHRVRAGRARMPPTP